MWEDTKNKNGGRWLFSLEKRDRRDLLDHCWLETVSTLHVNVMNVSLRCTVCMWMYVYY